MMFKAAKKYLIAFLKEKNLFFLFEYAMQEKIPLFLVGGATRDVLFSLQRRKNIACFYWRKKRICLKKLFHKRQHFSQSRRLCAMSYFKKYTAIRDLDFASPLPLEFWKEFFTPQLLKERDISQLEWNESYQSVSFVCEGLSCTLSRFRREDNVINARNAEEISFTTEIREDARRRDFDVNAFYFGVPILSLGKKEEQELKFFQPITLYDKKCTHLWKHPLSMIGYDEEFRVRQDTSRFLRALRLSLAHRLPLSSFFKRFSFSWTEKERHSSVYQKEAFQILKFLLSEECFFYWQKFSSYIFAFHKKYPHLFSQKQCEQCQKEALLLSFFFSINTDYRNNYREKACTMYGDFEPASSFSDTVEKTYATMGAYFAEERKVFLEQKFKQLCLTLSPKVDFLSSKYIGISKKKDAFLSIYLSSLRAFYVFLVSEGVERKSLIKFHRDVFRRALGIYARYMKKMFALEDLYAQFSLTEEEKENLEALLENVKDYEFLKRKYFYEKQIGKDKHF